MASEISPRPLKAEYAPPRDTGTRRNQVLSFLRKWPVVDVTPSILLSHPVQSYQSAKMLASTALRGRKAPSRKLSGATQCMPRITVPMVPGT